MDILAARKKAAEQANARNKPEPGAVTPAEQPSREPEAPAEQPSQEPETPESQPRPEPQAPPAPSGPGPDGIGGSPSTSGVAPTTEESHDKAGIVPGSAQSEEIQQREIELLSFRLGDEVYAVLVADVREVLKSYHLTIVPNTPEYVLGVMSLRGTMLPIIDLRRRFGLAPAANDEKSRIVVVSSTDEEAGLLVDQVTGVFRVLPHEVKAVPENLEQGAEFLRGIVRKADQLYILLDLGKALGV